MGNSMSQTDRTPSPVRDSTELWVAALLLGTQSILYLIYPGLEHLWEFVAFSTSATLFLAIALWETWDRVRGWATHTIHLLILADTQIEGVLQYWVRNEPRVNLYCVVGFAFVIAVHRLTRSRKQQAD